jgi:hypothetical protein
MKVTIRNTGTDDASSYGLLKKDIEFSALVKQDGTVEKGSNKDAPIYLCGSDKNIWYPSDAQYEAVAQLVNGKEIDNEAGRLDTSRLKVKPKTISVISEEEDEEEDTEEV